MNALFTVAEMAVSWAFPQVGATLQSYRMAKTAYSIGKIGISYFTGDVVSGSLEVVRLGAREACEQQRDVCVNACMRSGIWSGFGDVGACLVGCDLAYRACIGLCS